MDWVNQEFDMDMVFIFKFPDSNTPIVSLLFHRGRSENVGEKLLNNGLLTQVFPIIRGIFKWKKGVISI